MAVKAGYKQTEIGVIPEDWDVKYVHEFAAVQTGPFGTLLKSAEYSGKDGVPLISVGEIREGFLKLTSHTPHVPETVVRRLPQFVLKEGDIVFGRKGGVERSALIRKEQNGWFLGSDGISIRPSKQCHDQYLALQFQSDRVQGWLIQNAIGTTMASLNQKILKSVAIPLPRTKVEQEIIAEMLNDADNLLESLEKLITKKRHIKQGAMQELLTAKKRLPGFSGEWEVKQVGEFAACTSGGTPSTLMLNYWNGPIRWMSSGELNLKSVCEVEGRITEEGLRNSSTKMIPPNSVLVGLAGQGKTRGTVAITRIQLCTNQSIAAILPNATFDPEYLYYALDARYRELRELSTGDGGRGGLNLTIIRSLAFPFPKLREQTAIATSLSDIDAEIASLEAKLAKYRQLRQGMMQNLLTGKIRLVAPAFAQVEPPAATSEAGKVTAIRSGSHTWAFNEAVIISVLADQFGKPEFPLGRKRRTKLSYLFHRKTDQEVKGYLKKAAGPYNPKAKYAGPEKIAQENGYVRNHQSGKFNGFIAGGKIAQAKTYFANWYDPKITAWLEQFRFKSNDELECLATVDMVMQELLKHHKTADVDSIRALIASEPNWLPKLDRSAFSDSGIAEAITQCHALFG